MMDVHVKITQNSTNILLKTLKYPFHIPFLNYYDIIMFPSLNLKAYITQLAILKAK